MTLLMTTLHCYKGVSDTIRRLNFCREAGEGSEFEYRQEGERLIRYRYTPYKQNEQMCIARCTIFKKTY